ncbi:MAG TPA: hypothetical protein VE684_20800 [Crenalkalicoccus sp.]|nr:hypothetical protein [Crenalkalicoccus sp.]
MSDLMPPMLQPADPDALLLYTPLYTTGQDVDGNAVDPVTRNLVCVGLSAVGRCSWNASSSGLATARAGIYDWSAPVCCWASVVLWGAISGALTHVEVGAFVRDLKGATGTSLQGGEVGVAKRYLWDGVGGKLGLTQWSEGAQMPLGAMVFCGRDNGSPGGNELYHVALHVGRGLVVGSCMPVFDDATGRAKVNEMSDRGLSAFTTLLPVKSVCNKPEWTFFTRDAFWKGWPKAA